MNAIRLLLLIMGLALISSCAQTRQPDDHLAIGRLFSEGQAKLIEYTNHKAATERHWVKGREAQGLLCGAAGGDFELVLHLLKLGISADSTFQSRPAACDAVWGNHEDILMALADAGANLSATWFDPYDNERDSLLNVAYRENADSCIPILIAEKAVKMPSTSAVEKQRKNEWLREAMAKYGYPPN